MRERDDAETWRGAHIVGEQELSFVSDARAKRTARRRQNVVFAIMAVMVLVAFIGATLVFTGVISYGGKAAAGAASEQKPNAIKDPDCPQVNFTYQKPGSFKVRVINTTDTAGLATSTAETLEKRGFKISAVSSGLVEFQGGVGAVLAGPDGYAQAFTIQRQVPGTVFVFDEKMYGTDVDLALGSKFDYLVKERKLNIAPGPLTCR